MQRKMCSSKFLKQMHPVVPGAKTIIYYYILRDAALVIAACGIVSIFSLLGHRALFDDSFCGPWSAALRIVAIILYYPDQQSQDELSSLVEAFKSLQTISALKRSKASSSTTSSTTFTKCTISPISPANHPRPH